MLKNACPCARAETSARHSPSTTTSCSVISLTDVTMWSLISSAPTVSVEPCPLVTGATYQVTVKYPVKRISENDFALLTGYCTGPYVGSTRFSNQDCRVDCQDMEECQFWSYHPDAHICLLMSACDTVNYNCDGCVYGEKACKAPFP